MQNSLKLMSQLLGIIDTRVKLWYTAIKSDKELIMDEQQEPTVLEANINMIVKDFYGGMIQPPGLDHLQEFLRDAFPDELEEAMEYLQIADLSYYNEQQSPHPQGVLELREFINNEIQ